jgi:hypothetical protein
MISDAIPMSFFVTQWLLHYRFIGKKASAMRAKRGL